MCCMYSTIWAGSDLSAGELSGFPDPSISEANWLVKVVIQNICSAVCFTRTMAVCFCHDNPRIKVDCAVGQLWGNAPDGSFPTGSQSTTQPRTYPPCHIPPSSCS